jgi:hypothetical protein
MRARDENTHYFVESLLSKFGRPGRFHPNPQPRGSQTPPRKLRPYALGFLSRRPLGSEFVLSVCLCQRDCNSVESDKGHLPLRADERVSGVSFSDDSLSVTLKDGRLISVPLAWYPKLLHSAPEQLNHSKIAGGGYGIHWPDLDEDLSTEGLL